MITCWLAAFISIFNSAVFNINALIFPLRRIMYIVHVAAINEKNKCYKGTFLTKVNRDFCGRNVKMLMGI